jgi:hypothetical protein
MNDSRDFRPRPLLSLSAAVVLVAAGAGRSLAAAQDAAAATPDVGGTMLRLRSGDITFGEIVGHDPDGIRVRLLETGGEVELPWSTLDPTEADELRLTHGYVEASSEELLVDAERIELVNGQEVIGRIVERNDREVWVKRAEGTVPIPVTQIRGAISTVQAPALDLFTKEELYQQKAFELQGRLGGAGRSGAQAHDELAKHAERLLDFAHALEHYQRAAERDPTFDPERLAQAIARATQKAALQQQVDHLSEIDLARARKRYDRAIALLAEFRTLYPKSPLLEDLTKLQDRVAKSQERDLREEVVARWHFWAVRLAREAARKPTFEEVQAYLDEKMGEDVAQKVRDDVQTIAPGIEVDQVRRIFGERKGGKYRTATYGGGTWLLGESAREELDQTKDEKKEEPVKGTQSEARKKLEDRIKHYLENQKLTRSSADAAEADDPQVFWDGWNWSGRSQWVLAYYAEKSGDMKDLQSRFSNCRECGGTGARDMLFTGSAASSAGQQAGEILVPCPACHTIGIVRRIRYR